MTETLLTLLRWCFLGLLYLFFFRVLQATWAGSRAIRTRTITQTVPSGAAAVSPGGSAGPAASTVLAGAEPAKRSRRETRAARKAAKAAAKNAGSNVEPGGMSEPRRRASDQIATKLIMIEPEELVGREYLVNSELTIGRAASCQITLDDTYISQLHARVTRGPEGLVIEDLGSTNGSYLNRQRLTSKAIGVVGDRLRMGGIVMELR